MAMQRRRETRFEELEVGQRLRRQLSAPLRRQHGTGCWCRRLLRCSCRCRMEPSLEAEAVLRLAERDAGGHAALEQAHQRLPLARDPHLRRADTS